MTAGRGAVSVGGTAAITWVLSDRVLSAGGRSGRPAVEVGRDLVGRPPGLGVAVHRGAQQRLEPAGPVAARRLLVDDPVERAHEVLAGVVRRLALDHVVERGPERPDVAGRGGALAGGHLGSEVARRAGDEARLGQGDVRLGTRDAEVAELQEAVAGDQHVAGLHVAVDDAGPVGGGERVGRLGDEPAQPRPARPAPRGGSAARGSPTRGTPSPATAARPTRRGRRRRPRARG